MTDPTSPDAMKPITISAEAKKLEGEEIKFTDSGSAENTMDCLGSKSQGVFARMSEGGKSVANKIYAGLNKIPGVSLLVEKMQIINDKASLESNQRLVDRQEKKAVGKKEKMDGLDIQIKAFDQSRTDIESAINNLKMLGMPGAESLQLQLKKMERQKADLLDKKNKQQSKMEAFENKAKLFTEKRDNAADRLIEKYDAKLVPMEKELGKLETRREEVDLLAMGMEIRHKDSLDKLNKLEDNKAKTIDSLRRIGWSDRKIMAFPGVKAMDGALKQGYDCMKKEKEALAKRREEINAKIAKADRKANPHRDKREKFIRAKEGRPLKIEVEERTKSENVNIKEDTQAHVRAKADTPMDFKIGEDNLTGRSVEANKGENNRMEAGTCIENWNSYLQEKNKKLTPGEVIDPKDFIRSTVGYAGHKLDLDDFKNLLWRYIKVKKMPREKFEKHINGFLKKMEKQK